MLYTDAYLSGDISILFHCLRGVRAAMEGEVAYYFEQDLYYTADPAELAARNVEIILSDSRFVSGSGSSSSSSSSCCCCSTGGGGGGDCSSSIFNTVLISCCQTHRGRSSKPDPLDLLRSPRRCPAIS